jgi:hypothetical protein
VTDQSKGFDSATPVKRQMSIRQALEWAFAVERVSVEFDEIGEGPGGVDTIWRMMQRGRLGCRVDGGGRSPRHDDAEIIASFVANLREGCGGRGMAVEIARLARCGAVPDWMPGAVPRCVPVDVVENRHGVFARTSVVGRVEVRGRRGRRKVVDVLACPVTFRPTAAQIAAARREYLLWWSALLHLRDEIAGAGLRRIELTREMPPQRPWDTTA